jgi:hypothetical protein
MQLQWVFALLRLVFTLSNYESASAYPSSDTGAERKALCLSLGASHWIDFKGPAQSDETVDGSVNVVKEVLKVTDGRGAHAAIVTAHDVSASILPSSK